MTNLRGLKSTAIHLGISPEELMLSRQKGLHPGIDGFKAGGRLVWDLDELIATRPVRDLSKMTKPALVAAAKAQGLDVTTKATKADLIEMLSA
jgi:hypothetical protein